MISESVAYDVRPSVIYAENIEACFTLSNVSDQNLFNSLVVFHNENGVLINRTSSRDFPNRKICASVTSLSPFVVAAPGAPTAASVSVSGRVLTPAGEGLTNAVVLLTDAQGSIRTTRTNPFGYYRFETVSAGQTYIFEIRSKQFSFVPQVVGITEDTSDLNFTALF